MKKSTLLSLLLIMTSGILSAQSTWQRQYSITQDTVCSYNDLLVLPDGYIAVGTGINVNNTSLSDILLTRLNNDGIPLWSRKYDIYDNERGAVVKAFPGGGYMLLINGNDSSSGNEVYSAMRTDTSGSVVWTYTPVSNDVLSVGDISVLADGTTILAGLLSPCDTNVSCGIAIALDSTGNEMWTKSYSHPVFGTVSSMFATSDNHLLFAGVSYDLNLNASPWLYKTDLSGNLIWSNIYSGSPFNLINDVIEYGNAQSYILTGETGTSINDPTEGLVMVIDTAGNSFGSGAIGTGGRSSFLQATYLPTNGNVLLSGYTITDTTSANPVAKGYLVEADISTGTVALSSVVSDNQNSGAITKVALDTQGNLLLSFVDLFPSSGAPYSMLKLTPQIPGIACFHDVENSTGNLIGFTDSFGGAQSNFSFPTVALNINSQFVSLTDNLVCTLASIAENNQSVNLQVFPNPAKDILYISEISSVNRLAEIRDIRGAVVKSLQLAPGENAIDLSSIESGLYFLKVNSETGNYVTRFVKTK